MIAKRLTLLLIYKIWKTMTSVIINDASLATNHSNTFKNQEMIPISQVKVVKVVSMADFKSKNIDFRSLRPAVLINQTLLIKNQRNFWQGVPWRFIKWYFIITLFFSYFFALQNHAEYSPISTNVSKTINKNYWEIVSIPGL